VVTTIGNFSAFRRFGQGHYIVFQFAGRIVTDARHQTYLMIDEDKCRIFEKSGARRGGFDWSWHSPSIVMAAVGYANKLTIAEQQSDR